MQDCARLLAENEFCIKYSVSKLLLLIQACGVQEVWTWDDVCECVATGLPYLFEHIKDMHRNPISFYCTCKRKKSV